MQEKVHTKKVHMISLGCPKNLVDAEMMLGSLSNAQYNVTQEAETADTIIINTCSFIEESRKESVQTILEMAQITSKDKNKKLVVTGCLPQRYKDELVESLPEVDLFIGSGEFQNIGKIIEENRAGKEQKSFFHLPTFLQQKETPRLISGPKHRAFLKISEGCKKRCAFCAIPKIRGNLQSRNIDAIISEARLLAAGGVKELIIVSHDFTDYGWDLRRANPETTDNNVDLLKALDKVEGIEWIRIMYLYPDGITKGFLDLLKTSKKILPYFDMPLQHISDPMLKAMNRKMTKAEILERLQWIREVMPDAVIRTQFIVGFPGESQTDFQELLNFIEDFRFDRVGCFQYSKEEHTAAGRLNDQVSEILKQERFDQVMALQANISRQMHARFIGRTMPVLVEGYSEESELLLQGRMAGQAHEIDGVVYINDGKANMGEFVNVMITDSHDYDLVGHIV